MLRRLHKNQSGISWPIVLLILFVIIVAIYFSSLSQSAVKVTSYSINPSTIKVSGIADLSIGLKNEDRDNSHNVKLVFTAHRYASLSIGEKPLSRSDSDWVYEFTMVAGQERTEHISVRSQLGPGDKSLTYSISVVVYADGKQAETKTSDLTVTAS